MGTPCGNFFRIRWSIVAAVVMVTLPAALAQPAVQPSKADGSGSRAELIVQLESNANADAVRDFVRRADGRVTRDLHLIDGLGVEADAEVAHRLARLTGVRSVVGNAPIAPAAVDTSQLSTTYNQTVRSASVWNAFGPRRSSAGAGVGVAVIDTGIEGDLPDFRVSQSDSRSRVINSAVVNPDATSAGDEYGHGTHVAGIIAGNGTARAASDPLYGKYIGVAPAANLISVKVSDDEGNATTIDVIDGLQYAVDHREELNVRVANLSLSEDRPQEYRTSPLDAAVEQAWKAGIVVVAAAGNRGTAPDAAHYAPGNDPFAITVGASDDRGTASLRDDVAAAWSSTGTTQDGHTKPDLLAPGAHITSTLSEGSAITSMCASCVVSDHYFRMGGTSMAAAVASGALALMLENDPSLTPNQAKSAIKTNLRNVRGAGSVLDVAAAGLANSRDKQQPNDFEPNLLLDSATGRIDYARSRWSRSRWSGSSWSRSRWSASFGK
jgi:serine protease AprX